MLTANGEIDAEDQHVRRLIFAANQAAAQSNVRDAERLLREAEGRAPRHPLVLNQTAMRRLAVGDAAAAADLLTAATNADAANAELWFNLARALRADGRIKEALAAIERCLDLSPRNVLAALEKGAVQEALGESRAAAMTYRTTLQRLPPGYKPPPELEAAVKSARRAIEANNRELEAFVHERLRDVRKRGDNISLARFDQCVDIILRKRSISRQQPSFMYFPELPAIEFYVREQFPELLELEAAAADIRAELLDVMADGPETLTPYLTVPKGAPTEHMGGLANSRKWSAYYFWNEGDPFHAHMRRCPRTAAALQRWPLWDVPRNGPNAMFSILEPRTRIPAHTGTVNTRLVVHLPLIVPPDCGFRVGGQQREWIPGEAFVFDDSIDHEAWNDSDSARAVLIFTIWSPYLSDGERELVRELTTSVGDFYGVEQSAKSA